MVSCCHASFEKAEDGRTALHIAIVNAPASQRLTCFLDFSICTVVRRESNHILDRLMYAFIASEAWERGTAATKLVEACLDCCFLGDMISPLVYIRKLLHSLRLELPKTLQINMA